MRERVKKCFAQFWLADKDDNESSLLLILGRSEKTVERVGWMDMVYQTYR
jgi:hypothetical protein